MSSIQHALCRFSNMAEVIGTLASVATLAGLFKACMEGFEIIQIAKKQENDLKKLALRLNIERCRLYMWGQAMGLTKASEEPRPSLVEQCPFQEIVIQS